MIGIVTAITAGLSLAAFFRALLTVVVRFQLARAKHVRTRSKAQITRLEVRVRRVEAFGTKPSKPPAANESNAPGQHEWGWRQIEAWGRENPVALSLIVGCLFLAVTGLLRSSSASKDHRPTASFTAPEEGASVPYPVRVEGISSGVPLDSRPWLFVQSNDGDLYPQGGDHGDNVEINRSDGTWCGYAFSGGANRSSAGREYSLILALPTPEADRRLQRQMETRPAGGVPHWRSLPRNFRQLGDARNVIRLPDVQAKAQLDATASCP